MDCLEGMKQIEDNSIDLVVTDPPYGINYCSNRSTDDEYRRNVADTTEWDDFKLQDIHINEMLRVLKNDCYLYVFNRWDRLWELPKPDKLLVWFKNDYGMGNLADWSPSYEVILCFRKGNPILRGKRQQDVLVFNKVANFSVRANTKHQKMLHPTEKPIKLITQLILCSSDKDNIVLDPFMGSGTTAVACKQLGRNFIGFEIEPKYVEIANKRLEQTNIKSWFEKQNLKEAVK